MELKGNKTNFLGSSSEGKGYLATYNSNSITGYFGTGPNSEGIIGLHDANKNLGWSASGKTNNN